MDKKKEYAITVDVHVCKSLENCDFLNVVKMDYKGRVAWHWIFKEKYTHEIGYCPYCGEALL